MICLADNAMRLSEVLRQFASEAPWIQVEVQRTSAELYRRIEAGLVAEAKERKGELTEEDREAIREVARSCTPSFAVPSMNATVQLELARVSRRGWLLRRRTTREATDVSIDLTMEAAPLSPLAADPDMLPPSPQQLEMTSELSDEEVQECKRLMAGTPAEGDRPGERVELVATFLSSAESNWTGIWRGTEAAYHRLVEQVGEAGWSDHYRDAMRAILRQVLLVRGLETTGEGMRMRDYVRHLRRPNLLLLQHLRALKYIEDRRMLGE